MNLLKEENGGVLAGFHSILDKLKHCCCQLLNIHENIEFRDCKRRPQETAEGTKHKRIEV